MKYELHIRETPYADELRETHDDFCAAVSLLMSELSEIFYTDARDAFKNPCPLNHAVRFIMTDDENPSYTVKLDRRILATVKPV